MRYRLNATLNESRKRKEETLRILFGKGFDRRSEPPHLKRANALAQSLNVQQASNHPEESMSTSNNGFQAGSLFKSGYTTTVGLGTLMAAFLALVLVTLKRRNKGQRITNYGEIDEEKVVVEKGTRCSVESSRGSMVKLTESVSNSDAAMYGSCIMHKQTIDFCIPRIPSNVDCSQLLASSDPRKSLTGEESLEDIFPLQSALQGLNPELYKPHCLEPGEEEFYPYNHRGRIWIELVYREEEEQLEVILLKARNLPSRTKGSVNSCDPFVRVLLLPEERRYVQSKVKKKTCNPKFEETFLFQVPSKSIMDRVLRLTVYDNERGKRHNMIGEVAIPLKEALLDFNEKYLIWKDLNSEADEISDFGEINTSLYYNTTTEKLTVTVRGGKGFRWPEDFQDVQETYVKVSFMNANKLVKSKKGSICKECINPNYNETYQFKLQQSDVHTSNVIVEVYGGQANSKQCKCLGRVVLGSRMFSRGKPMEQWTKAIISETNKEHRQWQKLT